MIKKYFSLKILFLVFSYISFAQNPVPTIEYQALVDFYNATGGDSWRNKWDISSNNLHTTTWYGVILEDEHIVEIDLGNGNRLNGAIPASFSNLKFLRKLHLDSNDLSTTDLNNLSGLESMEDLDLSYCQLTGSIPSSWGQLTNLRLLELNNNNLGGALVGEIGDLTALEVIDLSENDFISMPESIGNLIALEEIYFSYNNFVSIPTTIGNLTNLKKFRLQYNELTLLPKELEGLISLTDIYVNNNQISDIEALLDTSVYLQLGSQSLTIEEFEFNGGDVLLSNLPNVTRYNRSTNDFTATNIFSIRIDGSGVGSSITANTDGSLLIPREYLSTLTPEKQVSLRQQSGTAGSSTITFTNTIVDLLEVSEVEYQALVDFYNATDGNNWRNKWDVSVNNLNLGAWYGMVIENGHIVEIDLGNGNRLNGAIPASFSNLKFLRKLHLDSNDLSTTDLNNLSGLESMEDLDLSYCQLTGSIPSSWGQLTNLRLLELNNNNLGGALVGEIGDLTALEVIDLSENDFISMPESIGNLIALEEIYFSYNNFVSIPTTIGNLTNLKKFRLQYNELTLLPKELEGLISLTDIYVNNNQISDIEALLDTSVYLQLGSQSLTIEEFEFNGGDVLLSNLPNVTRYNRSTNDFTATNIFSIRIDGSGVGSSITTNTDGSLLIPREYLSTLTPEKQVSLRQQSGTAGSSTITFTNTIVDLLEVSEVEYQALVDFYNATDGNNWRNKWDVSVNNLNLGAWYGMVIENGHIVEIDLGNGNRLNGAIPASFSNLKFLRKLHLDSNDLSTTDLNNLSGLESMEDLDLSYCQLTGSIPSSWGQLTNLRLLELNNNNLGGALVGEIGDLTALEVIDLSENDFISMPESIGNLIALEEIYFSYNNFVSIPTTIGNLTNLKKFRLQYNELTLLPKELEGLISLTDIYVNNNQISDIEALLDTSVYLQLGSQSLTIEEFEFNGGDVLLSNLPNVTRYNRSTNDFTATNIFSIRIDGSGVGSSITANTDGSLLIPREYLSTLTPEKQVSLRQQSGTAGSSTITFTNTIVDLLEVSEVEYQALVDFYNATDGNNWRNKWDVSVNNLNLGAWYGMVIENGHIVEIDLGNGNRLNGAIPASFSNLKFLRKLHLDSNDLSTTDLNNLSGLESMEDLDLSYCQLTGSIPSSWGQLTNLRLLELNNNNLGGALVGEIGDLTALEVIDLSENDFISMPESIGNLIALEEIYFSYNNFVSIPTTIGNLTNLKKFRLQYNELTLLPKELEGLISLTDIYVNNNQISDIEALLDTSVYLQLGSQSLTIEEFEFNGGDVLLSNLPNVTRYNRSTNDFTATNIFSIRIDGSGVGSSITANTDGSLLIPREYLSTLTPEKQVSLRQQSGTAGSSTITFTNTIFGDSLVDEEFEILKKLYNSTNGAFWTNIWDISQNNLNLSSWYGVSIEDGHVISIDLFNNNLSGVIPEEISGLKYLKTLTLNSNNISGNIPANINLLTDLESLDLSSNLLSGTIPTVISELQQLKKFSIGNNNFGGTIPTVLSDFIALEYLDISSNSFNKVEKKLYYDFTNTYIDLRNQTINSNTQLNLEEDQFKVELGNIVKYDLENNNYNAKNNFVLLVNDVIHTSTITNELGEVIFENVRIGEIPSDAKISIRQTTGTFRNTQFNFTGIEDKSDIPVLEQEYLALVDLYNQLNGDEWFNKWDVSSNNLHTNKWFGVSIYDGHVVAINLSLNNVTGIVPDIFNNLPYLNTLNLSSNKLTGVAAILPSAIDFLYYKQVIELGEVDLNRDTTVNDLNINRYDHSKRGYFNQTYNLRIGSFSKTVNLSEEGVRLIDLISMWKIPDNQILELRQVSGNATNSILSYYLKYQSGDSNLDSRLNILDLQTSINYYLGDNIDYFNYNATDINSDNSINILDLVKQVDIIQSQESVSTGKFSASIKSKTNNINAKISIENGKLLLDTKGNTVTSFEILIDNTSQELVEELVSNTGFTVSLKNRNNQVSFLAYSFDSSLNGVIELAKFNSNKPYIKAVILSDINAQEIPSEIVQAILAIDDLDIKEVSIAFNIPNPFQIETTISFLSNDNGNKAILSIFELSGRMVEKIELGNLVQGENSYVFKRKKLSSGIYLYKIASDDNKVIAKGKMTIK